MDETVRAVLAAKEQAAIANRAGMLEVASAEADAEAQLQELVAARAITKLVELKQTSLAQATILEVISIEGVSGELKRMDQAKGRYIPEHILYPREYKVVGASRQIAGWLVFTVVGRRHIDDGPYGGSLWEMYLDSECRFRWQACGGNRPARSPYGFEIANMPGYMVGQTYDFSADVHAMPMKYLKFIAIALEVVKISKLGYHDQDIPTDHHREVANVQFPVAS